MLNSLIRIAMRSPALRRFLNVIRVRELAAAVLRRRPLLRQVPRSSLTYRVAALDNLLVAKEIFEQGEYAALERYRDVRSFADLGCNCGYFTVFIAAHNDPATIRGLAIDAHPAMVEATRWHVERNGLRGVEPLWGLVGSTSEGDAGRFFVNIDSPGSSQFDRAPEGNVTVNPWREITAPVLSLEREWERRFGDLPCDVLKVDIEGSEEAFLHREPGFLSRVGILVIEIHKWIVDANAIDAFLDAHGFSRGEILRSNADVQVALYVNRAGRFAPQAPRAEHAAMTR